MNNKIGSIKRILNNMEQVQLKKYNNQLDNAIQHNRDPSALFNEKAAINNYNQNQNMMHFNNMNSQFAGIDEVFELDVNGTTHMSVNKSTLCKVPGSDLARFFNNQ